MADKPDPLTPDSQTSRRIKYGLNVAVAVLAAVAIVVLLNWIGYNTYQRFDFTATRKYSLSQQTRKLLGELEKDYQIVTLFAGVMPAHERVRDLVDEYGRYARRITVQHIDLNTDDRGHEQICQQVRQRYEDDLKPVADAIGRGREALTQARAATASLLQPLKEAAEDPNLSPGELKQLIQTIRAVFTPSESRLAEADGRIETALLQPLQNLSGAKSDLESVLKQLDENAFTPARDRLEKEAGDPNLPPGLRDKLLGIVHRLTMGRDEIRQTVEALRLIDPVEGYDRVRSDLLSTESIVVLGPDRVQVVPITEMFRKPDPQQARQAGRSEPRFLGEERLTGTLASMGMEQPPLVVFVLSGRGAAVGPGGNYEQVALRLRSVNFEVQQWNPTGQVGQFGQPMPPGPPPEPKPAQKAIWVILPFAPMNPMDRRSMGGDSKQQVKDLLGRRLEAGDAAMVMLTVDPLAQFGGTNPVVQMLSDTWGITPQLDRIVMDEVALADRQTQATSQIKVDQWPKALPITVALGGLKGLFLGASPLVVGSGDGQIKHHPLVELRGSRLWAETDFQALQSPDQATFKEAESRDVFVVGVAAENDGQRLIVVTDPVWASDAITTYGVLPGLGAGPGLADIAGAAFPANSELFVNGVYWLAGLDQLIAASPRMQDTRRIDPELSYGALIAYRWLLLAGMPIAVAAIGVGVWLVRRNG